MIIYPEFSLWIMLCWLVLNSFAFTRLSAVPRIKFEKKVTPWMTVFSSIEDHDSDSLQPADERTKFSAFNKIMKAIEDGTAADVIWEQVKLEAQETLSPEPEAGPQLYQCILSQKSLLEAIVTTISHEIETELMPATAIKNLFLETLTTEDEKSIYLDVMAVVIRSPSVRSIMTATLFHKGVHALVCFRVGHRLWQAGRTGLAYFMQSTVSRKYCADIHPAARIGSGVYLNAGGGVVIGETAVVGKDVIILQGVTLGGTGKESGDRHPKVGNGVILHPGATVLGNIAVGDGALVQPKSIVTKPVPPLARVNGVPARIHSYREVIVEEFEKCEFERFLGDKYLKQWQELAVQTEASETER
mmetsp:Transcript_11554/g.17764  ORF Transcript_11554/g.17764 Transcript_11554/m.17764 type:complete len:359 (+) Transcript_11554:92-1168(+)